MNALHVDVNADVDVDGDGDGDGLFAPRPPFTLLALLLLLIPARALAAPSPAEVGRLVDEWRFEEADAAEQELLRASPNDPAAVFLDGNLRFLAGDYEGASRRLQGVAGSARGPLGEDAASLRDLVVDTIGATRGFVETRSPDGHFVIRSAPGRDELLVPYALAALEAARREIGLHDFEASGSLGDPVRVEIFPAVADLAKVSTLTLAEIETSGTIAVCKFNKLMIASPRALVHGYPWLDTLAHEYTHFIISRVSHNTVPIWLHEGLAKFEERRWRLPSPPTGASTTGAPPAGVPDAGLTPTQEHLLATALGRGHRLITFEEMSPSMAKLPSQEDSALAFAEVYTVIEYLHARKGWEGIRQVIARMREGDRDGDAMAGVVGQSFAEFQKSWRAWLKGRKLRARPGLMPASLKFAHLARDGKSARQGDENDERDATDADDAQDVHEERARKYVRLGGMLRTRGRLAAAAVEYEKAEGLVGPGHFVVANKLARTWLTLGNLDRAIAAAAPAFDLYPDTAGAAAILGEAWWRKHDPERALPYLEAALRVNPFDPLPHCALAEIYAAKSGDPRAEHERTACRALSR